MARVMAQGRMRIKKAVAMADGDDDGEDDVFEPPNDVAGAGKPTAREQRLAAAMRANLRRRKAALRDRTPAPKVPARGE